MSQRVTTSGAPAMRAISAAILVIGSVFILAAATSVASAEDEQVVAVVDDDPITANDFAQRRAFNQLSTHREWTRQEVLDELIAEKRKLHVARKARIDVADSDVDAAYADMARLMNLTAERLTAILAHAGVDVSTLRNRIRADIAWRQYQYVRVSGSPIRLREDPPPGKKDDGPTWRE